MPIIMHFMQITMSLDGEVQLCLQQLLSFCRSAVCLFSTSFLLEEQRREFLALLAATPVSSEYRGYLPNYMITQSDGSESARES